MPLGPLKRSPSPVPLYEADFFRWTQEQGRVLREREPSEIDWENVAEEIETLGRTDKRSIEGNLNVILLHLLKWQYQPQQRKGGWNSSIFEHRDRVRRLLKDSPSLRTYPREVLAEEYAIARRKAAEEMGVAESVLPTLCPFSVEDVLDFDFLPERDER
jgi:hypothetical protein